MRFPTRLVAYVATYRTFNRVSPNASSANSNVLKVSARATSFLSLIDDGLKKLARLVLVATAESGEMAVNSCRFFAV